MPTPGSEPECRVPGSVVLRVKVITIIKRHQDDAINPRQRLQNQKFLRRWKGENLSLKGFSIDFRSRSPSSLVVVVYIMVGFCEVLTCCGLRFGWGLGACRRPASVETFALIEECAWWLVALQIVGRGNAASDDVCGGRVWQRLGNDYGQRQ